MARRHPALGQRTPQIDGLSLAVAVAEQFGLKEIEKRELFVAAQRFMVGDIVGRSDEVIEREDQATDAADG